MPATFSVPARAPRSWPPPLICGSSARPSRLISAPTPCGPPILCDDSVIRSAPSVLRSQAMRPGPCTASTWRSPPAAWTSAAASATGWITPVSLLASISDTSGRVRPSSSRPQRREIDGARGRHRNFLGCGKSPTAPHRRMLDRRHQQRVAERRRERQHIGFGAARGEHHVARHDSDQGRHLLARRLNQTARGAAGAMHRRRIAGHLQRCHHRGLGLGAQRRRGVPVEIGLHHLTRALPRDPSKPLTFLTLLAFRLLLAPGVMLRTRAHRPAAFRGSLKAPDIRETSCQLRAPIRGVKHAILTEASRTD